ncbi:DUF4047 domain-containing protein [Bacillus sp. S14(2024)]|uniref:DUF4047 domain-containing protein n=1 Tax=Bacillus sp. S14(2024) TaxID=3162884 RepID=UPI003D220889
MYNIFCDYMEASFSNQQTVELALSTTNVFPKAIEKLINEETMITMKLGMYE